MIHTPSGRGGPFRHGRQPGRIVRSVASPSRSGIVVSPPVVFEGTWPDNEPGGLSPVFGDPPTGQPAGTLIDGSDAFFDYSGSGGDDLGATFSFGAKWDGTIIEKTTSSGSRYANVIRKNMFIGDTSGWNGFAGDDNFAANYEALYFRMIFKLSSNWQREGSGDKLWYWGQAGSVGNAFYIYLRNNGDQGEICVVNQAPNGEDTGEWRGSTGVSKGEWHTIEMLVNAQSALGVADGSWQVFLDDVEVADFTFLGGGPGQTGIEWYASGSPTRLFSGIQLYLFWGGQGSTKTVNDYIDISEFYITGTAA